MADKLPDLFSYIVESDNGFSPNPFGGVCTLACSKPKIRYYARIGDWIIGTTIGPKKDSLVFAMQISRALTFDLYWKYPEYNSKKPNKNNLTGDNIYKSGDHADLEQVPNQYHNAKHFKGDTSVNRVLISNTFYYFGNNAPDIPEQYRSIISPAQGFTHIKPTSKNSMAVSVFLIWLSDNFKQGINGEPAKSDTKKKTPVASVRLKPIIKEPETLVTN
jgi:hypothetical protein